MARALRISWLSFRGLLALTFVLGLIETAQGAPGAVKWLRDAGITQSHTLGVVLAATATIIVGLVALGPERVKHWSAIARGQPPAPSAAPKRPVSAPSHRPAREIPARVIPGAQREQSKHEATGELRAEQLSPELRAWLSHERERGTEFGISINKQKRRLAGESSFILDSLSMFTPDPTAMLRRLTERAAAWSVKVQHRLIAELPLKSDAFDGKPPPAHPDPTQGDFDRLAGYIEQRVEVLKAILGES